MRLWSKVVLSLIALALTGAFAVRLIVRRAVAESLIEEAVMRAAALADGFNRASAVAATLAADERALLAPLMSLRELGVEAAYVVGRTGVVTAHTDVTRHGLRARDAMIAQALAGTPGWALEGNVLRYAAPLTRSGDVEERLFGSPDRPAGALVFELPMKGQLDLATRLSNRVVAAIFLVSLVLFVAALWAIARLLRFFERSVDTMLDGVIVIDGRGRIELLNATALKLLGDAPAARWRARPLAEAFPDCPELIETLGQGLPVRDLELQLGETPLLCAANPFEAGDSGAGAVLTLKDIGSRKLLERVEAERDRDAMQRDFVATVSHEFRTPVAAIKGFAETLLGGALEDAENRREFVQIISHHADRLAGLVEDLLRLSVLESGESEDDRRPIELAPFCEAVAKSMAPLVERTAVRLRLRVDPSIRVCADADQLEQVLLNLLRNALEYNRPDGEVTVEAVRRGGHAHVSVVDTGMGIAPEDQEKVFRRFHRSLAAKKKKAQGTGLGLLICRRIVERQGGLIWVESELGVGSTFHFTMPLETRDTSTPPPASNKHETLHAGRADAAVPRRPSRLGSRPEGQVAKEA